MAELVQPSAQETFPVALAIYFQPANRPRLQLTSGGLTKPGKYYLVGKFDLDGPVIVFSGPYLSDREAEQALKEAPVQAPQQAAMLVDRR